MIPDDHPLYFGRPGAIGQPAANRILQECDYLVCLGARLDLLQVGYDYSTFAPNAELIIVDIDPTEHGKVARDAHIYATDARGCPIRGDIPELDLGPWFNRCNELKAKYPVVRKDHWDQSGHVNPYVFIEVLSEVMTPEDILVCGSSGMAAEITMQAFRVKDGQRVIFSPGLGSMGFGLPAAIGACLASGKRRTVCIEGDGSIQMNMYCMELIRRMNLPINVFVLNNQGYSSIRNTQNARFNGRNYGCDSASGLYLGPIDKDRTIWINNEIRYIVLHNKPWVTEIKISPNQQVGYRIKSTIKDGVIIPGRLEDV